MEVGLVVLGKMRLFPTFLAYKLVFFWTFSNLPCRTNVSQPYPTALGPIAEALKFFQNVWLYKLALRNQDQLGNTERALDIYSHRWYRQDIEGELGKACLGIGVSDASREGVPCDASNDEVIWL